MNRFIIPVDEPGEIEQYYEEIGEKYQKAFAGSPWNEVSKCADVELRCSGGFSAQKVGEFCLSCGLCPTEPAYYTNELIEGFDGLRATRPLAWYLEFEQSEIALAAIAWLARPSTIAAEKYSDVPVMQQWFVDQLSDDPIVWLDDIFADKEVRARNNLANFGAMTSRFADELGTETVAYRTITPQMVMKGRAIGGTVLGRNSTRAADLGPTDGNVPDRRDLVIIKTGGRP